MICICFVSTGTFRVLGAETQDKPSVFAIRQVVAADSPKATDAENLPWAKPRPGQTNLLVAREILLEQGHIQTAQGLRNPITHEEVVHVTLTPEGAKQFAKVTRENIGKQLAIVVGGKIMVAPQIGTEIGGGVLEIAGNFSADEIQNMVKILSHP